ncbi:MAG: lysozyme inhibitor LprI family protein [Terracidiphilus sp.]
MLASALRKPGIAARITLGSCVLFALHALVLHAAAQQGAPAAAAQAAQPQPIQFQDPIPNDQLAFLTGYAGQPSKELEKDKRFRALMKGVIPRTEYHYGRDMSLSDATDDVLGGSRMPVEVHDGRYVTIAGHQGPYLRGRGFLWFDTQQGIALGAFYFEPTNGEPTPTLTVFSKQLTDKVLMMSQFPPVFIEQLYEWAAVAGVPTVLPRYFIPQNGKKYVLMHDEDYCGHAANAPALSANVCERLNAEAADADMNAAYFMKETHNAANATAWMLSPEQVAWIGFRDRSCVATPDRWGCQIRLTRERTWSLIGMPPRPPRPEPPNPRGSNPSR